MIIGTGNSIFSQTVQIGTQVWMTKNLDLSTFRNGDPIPEAKTEEEWTKAGENHQPAWCYYDKDVTNGAKYGKLYNWYAVNDARGLAPVGYHIPTDDEWMDLEDFLGPDAGDKMKSTPIYETNITYEEEEGYYEEKWVACQNCAVASPEYKKTCPSCKGMGGKYIKTGKYIPKSKRKVENKIQISGWNGKNSSDFCGLPGGSRGNNGTFVMIEEGGYWWSSSEDGFVKARHRHLHWDEESVLDFNYDVNSYKENGFSVRCLKD
jgi:uncharacterized protein (TIGR02145 family)